MSELFRRFAQHASDALGTHWAFVCAVAVVVCWAVTGPFFHWSDSWQIFINTATTIVTFLMVFIVQTTQNRDSRTLHLKLDELIRVQVTARNRLTALKDATEKEMEVLENEMSRLGSDPDIHLEGEVPVELGKGKKP